MKRRYFIQTLAAAPLLAAETQRKAPFRTLYSNDLTNITSCVSPFRAAKEPFRPEMLDATVDEVAGLVDAHFLQPGLGMVPLWPSKVIDLKEHFAWIKQRYGQKPDSMSQFVLNGGDIVQRFIDRCRAKGQAAFISLRVNDAHHKEFVDPKPGDKPGSSIGMSVTRWYAEHPEHRIVPGSLRGADLVLNWAEPKVPEQKLMLIRELCDNYDIDGLELDFLRFYSYFRAETPLEQRRAIMTNFVKKVRQMLGPKRWLCARVPCYLTALDVLGLDLKALVAAGLDMVNASAHYFTTQQHDLAAIRKMSDGAALYFELCHTIWKGDKVQEGYDVFPYRRATKEHLHTSAHLAYSRGADGISLFNFAYYRSHGQGEGRGVFGEPPFDGLKALNDPKALAQQPQHWFIAFGWRAPGAKPPAVPRKLVIGKPEKFNFDLASPRGEARVRIQTDRTSLTHLAARFNGEAITPTDDVSEPFEVPYPSMLGKPEELRAWHIPGRLLREGKNSLEVTQTGGEPVTVVFVDLAC
ncbi:MAG: hypothetical protein JNJ83_22310 [Verrucomicrobiaceae bacterium]|nr:hypothetical protein [Verrucomicrobiaceae bacterium]